MNTKILLSFITYHRLSKNTSRVLFLKKFCYLLAIFFTLKKFRSTISVNMVIKKKKKMFFALINGPKCHKVGKSLIKFFYNKFDIIILKKNNINIIKLINFFNKILIFYKYYQTNQTFIKKINVSLLTKLN